jgi:H/ACA ribonucleoprotein complex subunit 4
MGGYARMTGSPPAGPVAERIASGAFVLLDKPRGPSSHQVTAWARDLLGVPAAGHAGTLDPNVSGVLWVGLGPALRLVPLVLEFPKTYVGIVVLQGEVPAARLAQVAAEFVGPVYQTPPVRSAVKRERRVRTIHRLEVVERDGPRVLVSVVADSGTYVRTLAVDLGEALGVGAHLEELRRTATGPFGEVDAVPLSRLADARSAAASGDPSELLELLRPVEQVWREFPTLVLKDAAASAVAHGAQLAGGGVASVSRAFAKGDRVVLLDRRRELVATGIALRSATEPRGGKDGWIVGSTKVFADPRRFPPLWKRAADRTGPLPPAADG